MPFNSGEQLIVDGLSLGLDDQRSEWKDLLALQEYANERFRTHDDELTDLAKTFDASIERDNEGALPRYLSNPPDVPSTPDTPPEPRRCVSLPGDMPPRWFSSDPRVVALPRRLVALARQNEWEDERTPVEQAVAEQYEEAQMDWVAQETLGQQQPVPAAEEEEEEEELLKGKGKGKEKDLRPESKQKPVQFPPDVALPLRTPSNSPSSKTRLPKPIPNYKGTPMHSLKEMLNDSYDRECRSQGKRIDLFERDSEVQRNLASIKQGYMAEYDQECRTQGKVVDANERNNWVVNKLLSFGAGKYLGL